MRVLFYILLLIPELFYSQKQTAQWRFGYYAGLNFQNGTVQPVNNSTFYGQHSCASMSDSLGNLMFYLRSGDILFNKNNDTMANGLYFGGSYVGTQMGIILRKSGSQYYVITHNSYNYHYTSPISPMTNYAIVDMNLAAGLGSVTVSNQSISPVGVPMVSKMAATKHCNQKDYWLLTHTGYMPGDNHYYAYLVGSIGISNNPTITAIGSNQPHAYHQNQTYYRGFHKFSPNGRKVAATMPNKVVELYDFNNNTGVLSNVIKLDSLAVPTITYGINDANAIGLEFSPDGTKLYVSYTINHPFLFQYNLCAGSNSDIIASKTLISNDTITSNTGFSTLQSAPDGKIYCTNLYGSNYLDVINNPNALGIACSFSHQSLSLGVATITQLPAGCTSGLPNFESNFFEQKPVLSPISASIVCGQVSFVAPSLCAAAGYSVSSYQWSFNDPVSGANTATLANPSHVFSANGTYTAQLVLHYHPCGTDTLKQTVNITGLPTLSVTGKSKICKGENAVLSFAGATNYSINTVAVNQGTAQLQPTVSTVYTITATNTLSGCSTLKTVSLTVIPCTGIATASTEQFAVSIYPNPTDGKFMIESEAVTINVKVYNQLGMLVYQGFAENGKHSIDISNQANGIYFVEVQNETFVKTQKLIKR